MSRKKIQRRIVHVQLVLISGIRGYRDGVRKIELTTVELDGSNDCSLYVSNVGIRLSVIRGWIHDAALVLPEPVQHLQLPGC